jgi:hypothetical protein
MAEKATNGPNDSNQGFDDEDESDRKMWTDKYDFWVRVLHIFVLIFLSFASFIFMVARRPLKFHACEKAGATQNLDVVQADWMKCHPRCGVQLTGFGQASKSAGKKIENQDAILQFEKWQKNRNEDRYEIVWARDNGVQGLAT